jgi:hypothetical protein
VHTTDGELQSCAGGTRLRRLLATRLALAGLAAGLALTALATTRFASARLRNAGEEEKRDGEREKQRRRERRGWKEEGRMQFTPHMYVSMFVSDD